MYSINYYSIVILLLLGSIFCRPAVLLSQNDTIITHNDNIIIGQIKNMDKGVLTMETEYSKSDFTIEWEGIREIYSSSYFLFTTSQGLRISGSIRSIGNDMLELNDNEGNLITIEIKDLVYIKSIEQKFLSRFTARVDLGYSLTKANNLEQFTVNSRFSYIVDLRSLEMYYNSLLSRQDSIQNIERYDAGLTYRYFLPKDWFLASELTFLSNTEQALELRSNLKAGLGKFLIHTNKSYFGVGGGASANMEEYDATADSEVENRESWEVYIGTDLNLYDIGDLNLFLSVFSYAGITEKDRVRVDGRFDAKYDLPFDFYVKAGLTVNYDNQSAIQGNQTDYVFTTGFGWEW